MTELCTAKTPLGAFLSELAAGESTPGGGAAAALTGCQSAALLSMVLNFTVGRKKYAAVEEEMQKLLGRTEDLRVKLLTLADEDAEAFGAVAACYAMPRKTDAEKAARTEAMQQALRGAAVVPFTIASLCSELLEITPPIAEKGNANVVSDAATAAHLAHAALLSAIVNVDINLKFLKDVNFVTEMKGEVTALKASAETHYETSRVACAQALGVAI